MDLAPTNASRTTALDWDILLRLPLPALFRMKCVCREWNRTISDPSFVSDYCARKPPPFAGYFVQPVYDPSHDQLRFTPASDAFKRTNPALAFGGFKTTILASSSGLLLCRTDNSYFVCEPLTRRWRSIPFPMRLSMPRVVGFIHRLRPPTQQDSLPRRSYKVVRVSYHSPRAMAVEAFSSDSGEWESSVVASPAPFYAVPGWLMETAAVAVSGALHWLDSEHNVVAYDVDEASLRLVEPPPRTAALTEVSVCDVGGRLSYCRNDQAGIDVWVLGDGAGGQWEHRHRVEFSSIKEENFSKKHPWNHSYGACVRGFHPDDPGVAILEGPSKVFEYDLSGGRTRVLSSTGICIHRATPYVWPAWCFEL